MLRGQAGVHLQRRRFSTLNYGRPRQNRNEILIPLPRDIPLEGCARQNFLRVGAFQPGFFPGKTKINGLDQDILSKGVQCHVHTESRNGIPDVCGAVYPVPTPGQFNRQSPGTKRETALPSAMPYNIRFRFSCFMRIS